MLVIKTGMQSEEAVAKQYAPPGALVLTGAATTAEDLAQQVPAGCTGIISFGLCGGLAPDQAYQLGVPSAQVGQGFIYSAVEAPGIGYMCDVAWRRRLFAALDYVECRCYSDGELNTANTVEQRAQLFQQTGCWVIDDESLAVAQFAQARGIPFAGLRVVSDGAEDNLPPAVANALNPDGSDDVEAVVASIISDPVQLPSVIKTAREFQLSIAELRTAAVQVGPTWAAP